MKLNFNVPSAPVYSSESQKIGILTENWVKNNIYCPACGNNKLEQFKNNSPVADFHCNNCLE